MIDLDELERLAKAGATCAMTGSDVADLIAEVRTLRARLEIDPRHSVDGIDARDATIRGLEEKLKTPVLTSCALFQADGAHHGAAETAFVHGASVVTVYYGEKRTYKSMAAFCEAHPKEGV